MNLAAGQTVCGFGAEERIGREVVRNGATGYRIQNTDAEYRIQMSEQAEPQRAFCIQSDTDTCAHTNTETSTHPYRCTHTEASTGSYVSADAHACHLPLEEG